MIAVGGVTLLTPIRAVASGTGEVQDLRREAGRLRAELLALQTALAETTELERQRDANLIRALKDDAPSPRASAAPPPPVPVETREPPSGAPASQPPAAAAPAAPDHARSAPRHRRHRRSGRSRPKPHAAEADR